MCASTDETGWRVPITLVLLDEWWATRAEKATQLVRERAARPCLGSCGSQRRRRGPPITVVTEPPPPPLTSWPCPLPSVLSFLVAQVILYKQCRVCLLGPIPGCAAIPRPSSLLITSCNSSLELHTTQSPSSPPRYRCTRQPSRSLTSPFRFYCCCYCGCAQLLCACDWVLFFLGRRRRPSSSSTFSPGRTRAWGFWRLLFGRMQWV